MRPRQNSTGNYPPSSVHKTSVRGHLKPFKDQMISRFVFFLAAALMTPCHASADGAPKQQFPASQCTQDEACVRSWWAEYKPAIIEEFKYWEGYAGALERRNQHAAEQAFVDAISEQRYKHRFWDIARGSNLLGVEYEEYAAVMACRSAIINLKYPLAALASNRDAEEGVQAFETDAKVCRTVAYQSEKLHARKRR